MNPSFRRLERIACRPRQLDTGEFIYHQGDDSQAIYLVLTGTVWIARLAYSGNEVTIAHVGAGECFGDAEVLIGLEARECFAQAICPTVIQAVLVDDLSPEMIAELRYVTLDRLFQAQLCMADMIAESPQRRVLSLLRHLSVQGSTIRLSQSDIGRATGCIRDTVSKVLIKLEKAGAVQVERCVITILDPQLLEV